MGYSAGRLALRGVLPVLRLYREWEGRLPVTMRQTHAPGERLFVDYAGDGVPVVIDRLTGEIRKAQIFVAVIGRHRGRLRPVATRGREGISR